MVLIRREKGEKNVDESFPFIHTFWYPISRNPFTSLLVYWYFHLMLRQVSHLVNSLFLSLSFFCYSIDIHIKIFVSTCWLIYIYCIQSFDLFLLQIPIKLMMKRLFWGRRVKGQQDAFRLTLTLYFWIFYVRNYNKLSDFYFLNFFLSSLLLLLLLLLSYDFRNEIEWRKSEWIHKIYSFHFHAIIFPQKKERNPFNDG